jgi:serine protease AprX
MGPLEGKTMAKITINGIAIDPSTQGPALAAAGLHAADAADSNYILIQTHQPLDKAQKAELEAKGVVILEYVPDNTYLCQFQPTNLDDIRALPYVAWTNVYMRGFKVAPALTALPPGGPGGARSLLEIAATPARTVDTVPKTVDIVFHRDVNPAMVRDKVAAAARMDPADVQVNRQKMRLAVQTQYLPDIAAIDEVRHVEAVLPRKLHNNVARQILHLDGNPGVGATFEGTGQVVAVADTGFDVGSTTNVHPAFTGRVAKLYALGRQNNANDPNGHGTHVAGSVLGDGTSATLGHAIRGTAPQARLVLQSVLDGLGGLGGLPDDLHDLFEPPYLDDHARIHTNSWGNIVGDGSYNENARELDDFVWHHRDCVICFSAGNEGVDRNANGQVDARSVTPPGTAKNCITIGASENNRPTLNESYGAWWPNDFPANPMAADLMADDPEGIVAFSSRGPTQDQRIKPDIVAPGTFILSARSRATSDSGWGLSQDPLYYFQGGTSMATPLVAGCVALVREFLARERQMPTPSAALVKAMLINGAQNLTGQYVPSESGRIPNHAEGFGRVDMAATIGPFAPNETLTLREEATALDTGEDEVTTVVVGALTATLKVTLVWTDPPGETLQNDLDLIVRAANGQERHGNKTPAASSFDRANNVEQVIWTGVPAGNVQIIVHAHRITQFPQAYALVVRMA